MSRVGLKIGLATTLLLLITMATASASTGVTVNSPTTANPAVTMPGLTVDVNFTFTAIVDEVLNGTSLADGTSINGTNPWTTGAYRLIFYNTTTTWDENVNAIYLDVNGDTFVDDTTQTVNNTGDDILLAGNPAAATYANWSDSNNPWSDVKFYDADATDGGYNWSIDAIVLDVDADNTYDDNVAEFKVDIVNTSLSGVIATETVSVSGVTNGTTYTQVVTLTIANNAVGGYYDVNITDLDENTVTTEANAVLVVTKAKIVFVFIDTPMYADAKLYDMRIRIYNETYGVYVPWSGNVNLTFNTSKAWINNGTATFRQSAIVRVTDGVGDFSVGAFDNETYSNVTAELTGVADDTRITSNTTVIYFWAPSQLAYITGDYRKAEGGLLYESEVGGVWISVRSDDTGIILYSYLDVVNDAGYTVRVPLGNYTVLGDAKYYQAATATVAVDQPDRTFTADLVFVSDRKPSTIYIGYGHYTSADDMLNDINNGTLVKSKTNVATGDENDYEELTILVLDQYGDPISATVTVTIEPPGDLQVDGKYTTTTTVTVGTNGLGYVYVTCFGANETAKATYGPIATVNITAALSTNPSINDTATKTYVWKGNSSIFGQVYWVNEETGEKAPAVGAKVWAVYAGMSNHSLSYIEDIMPWMVDTVDEHGVYVLDGIAVGEHGTDVFIYVIYPGWNGINDTVPGLLASQGELDPAVEGSRGGCTGMYIAAAEYQHLRYDGDTENHDIKLDNPEPREYSISISEPRHVLVYNDKVPITISLVWYPKSNRSDIHLADNEKVKVEILPPTLGCKLDNGTVENKTVWVTVHNGTATVNLMSDEEAGYIAIKASFTYYDSELKEYVTIYAEDEKLIVDTAKISGDITDESGKQLRVPASNNQLIVALWMDNNTDGRLNTSEDLFVVAQSGGEVRDGIDAMEVLKALHGTIRPWTVYPDYRGSTQPVNITPNNPRFAAKEDAHYSFFNVTTGYPYIVEVIWLAKPPATTDDAVNQIKNGKLMVNYTVSYVPFFVEPGIGTVTVDVAVPKPAAYTETAPGTTVDQLKAEILQLIMEYMKSPSEDLKQQILQKIIDYLKYV